MFNALRSEQLLVGVGRMLRAAADADGRLEDYERSQVLSAYSVTRLLAAEQAAARELLEWTRAALDRALAGDERAEAQTARDQFVAAVDGTELGDALVELLAALPREDPTRTRVHGVLREMIDRELSALAAPVG
ncbi:MAG: hypothetical protein JWO90_436 [Solirubrobacterales bacterium]|jgi:hypothetical protein|nr:hypothetical protein [Solirubrobacterales bacterium]